jgi:hypothetical protein
MKINLSLLKEILEYCEKYLPEKEEDKDHTLYYGKSSILSLNPSEFPSLEPFSIEVIKYHIVLLKEKKFMFQKNNSDKLGALSVNGIIKLEEIRKIGLPDNVTDFFRIKK